MAAFLKLGDIKGEFAPSRQVEDNGDQVAQFTTGGGGDSIINNGGHFEMQGDAGVSVITLQLIATEWLKLADW